MNRLPLLPELNHMPWTAQQRLADKLGVHRTQLAETISAIHAAELRKAWRNHHHQPTPTNRETEIAPCDTCGHLRHKETQCRTCIHLSNPAKQAQPS